MMTRLSFATALGAGTLPLDRPLFEEDEFDGGLSMRPGVRGAGGARRTKINYHPGKPGGMAPADAAMLARELGDSLSASTREAIEAAPMPLRAALVLGSPEFMMR